MGKKINLEDLNQCESCEGYFDPEKTIADGDCNFCENCHEGILKEVRETGIKNLDEFLERESLKKQFHIFSLSKFHGVPEEDFED